MSLITSSIDRNSSSIETYMKSLVENIPDEKYREFISTDFERYNIQILDDKTSFSENIHNTLHTLNSPIYFNTWKELYNLISNLLPRDLQPNSWYRATHRINNDEWLLSMNGNQNTLTHRVRLDDQLNFETIIRNFNRGFNNLFDGIFASRNYGWRIF